MNTESETVLNSLGEAERAGGRILHELTDQAQSLELRGMLKKVGYDEGYYAGEMVAHLRRLGVPPSDKIGDFVDKVCAVKRLSESTGLESKTIHRLLEANPRNGGFKHCEPIRSHAMYWRCMRSRWWTCRYPSSELNVAITDT